MQIEVTKLQEQDHGSRQKVSTRHPTTINQGKMMGLISASNILTVLCSAGAFAG